MRGRGLRRHHRGDGGRRGRGRGGKGRNRRDADRVGGVRPRARFTLHDVRRHRRQGPDPHAERVDHVLRLGLLRRRGDLRHLQGAGPQGRLRQPRVQVHDARFHRRPRARLRPQRGPGRAVGRLQLHLRVPAALPRRSGRYAVPQPRAVARRPLAGADARDRARPDGG